MYAYYFVSNIVILRLRGLKDQFQQKATQYTTDNMKTFGEHEARRVSSLCFMLHRVIMKTDLIN